MLHNLARVTTSTTGTGTLNLGSAVSGFLTFAQAGVPDGGRVTYSIRSGAQSEIGYGTYTASGPSLSRDTVLASTAGGTTKITITEAQSEVIITPSAEDLNVGWLQEFSGTTPYAQLEDAITKMNANNNLIVRIPDDTTVNITSALSAITGNDCAIMGTGAGSLITLDSGIGTTGTFFQIGDTSTVSTRVQIGGLRLRCDNTPNADQYAFDIINGQNIDIYRHDVANLSGLANFGDGTRDAVRVSLDNIEGNYNNGTTTNGILRFQSYAMVRCNRLTLSENVSGATRTGANILVKPPSASVDFGDTSYITECSFIAWNETDGDYKPYGVHVVLDNEKAVNLWIDKHVGDHTGTAAVLVEGSGAHDLTCLKITNGRWVTDAGKGFEFNYNGSDVARNILVQGNLIHVQDGSEHVHIRGSGKYSGCKLIANDLSEVSGQSRTRSIWAQNVSGWDISQNTLSNRAGVDAAGSTTNGIQLSETDAEDFTITGNNFSQAVTRAISYPSYASVSTTRLFKDNLGPNGIEPEPTPDIASGSTVDLGSSTCDTIRITGTTTISSFGTTAPLGTVKHIYTASTPTFTHSSTLVCPDGRDLVSTANKALTAIRTSAGWTLIGHQSSVDGSTGWVSYATEAASIVFTSTADPSTVSSAQYRWRKCEVTGHVDFEINVEWSSAGTAVTSAELPFPSSFPTPSYPHGTPAADEQFGTATGFLVDGVTVPTTTNRAWLKYSGSAPIARVQGNDDANIIMIKGSYQAA